MSTVNAWFRLALVLVLIVTGAIAQLRVVLEMQHWAANAFGGFNLPDTLKWCAAVRIGILLILINAYGNCHYSCTDPALC